MADKPDTAAAPATEAAAAPLAPSSSSAAEASAAGTSAKAVESSAASTSGDAAAKPSTSAQADGAAPKSESPPSLLASADAGKRDGAPQPDAAAKPAETPSPADAKAKPETTDGKAPDAKPDAAKPADGAAAAAKDALAPPPAPPAYEAPKLPEGTRLDDKILGQVDKKFGDFEIAHKVDHGAMQALRQELINEYLSDVARIGEQVTKHQVDVWNRLNETRINELKADPELGGNRIETTLGNAKFALEDFGGLTKAELNEMLAVWDNGGVSNHRLTVKMLNNIYQRFQPPQPITPNNPAASKLMSQPGQRSWYDVVDGTAKSA